MMIAAVIVLAVESGGARGQEALLAVESVEGSRGWRVVYPAVANLRLDDVLRILNVFEAVRSTKGVPSDNVRTRSVTVSLAWKGAKGIDGWTSVEHRQIILPLRQAVGWPEGKLRRVAEHERAHIALGDFFDGQAVVTAWFEEGFAEWAAGGLSCEAEVRLEIEMRRRRALGLSVPRMDEVWKSLPRRLAYDVSGSFVEFLASRLGGERGVERWLENVKEHGWEEAVGVTFGADLRLLEAAWRREIDERITRSGRAARCAQTAP